MVDKNIRNTYFNAFVKEASKTLRSGIGIIMSFYGFPSGCVIKIDLKTGVAHHCEDKQDSNDLCDALFKTKLLQKEICESVRGKTISTTMVAVCSLICYVVLKSDKSPEWEENMAAKDFQHIIKKVYEKHGKK